MNLLLIEETNVTKSPDLTSILAAFESNKNPIHLFVHPSESETEQKLNELNVQMDNLIKLAPFTNQQCMQFREVERKFYQLKGVVERNYYEEATCAQCDTTFNLNNPEDLLNLDNHKHEDNFPIQSISKSRNRYRCLLCDSTFNQKSIASHISGKSHAKKINDHVFRARKYEFVRLFQQLPNDYHIFHVVFQPPTNKNVSDCFCTICLTNISIDSIPEHIQTQVHKTKFLSKDLTFLNHYDDMIDVMSLKSLTTTTTTNTNNKKLKHMIIESYKESGIQIPVRLQNHMKFLDDAHTSCTMCKMNIINVIDHLISDEHKHKTKLQMKQIQYYYYCCLCSRYIKTELKWMEHFNSFGHKQKESLMNGATLQTSFKEYECSPCGLVWYGQFHSMSAHKKGKFGVGEKRWKPKEINLNNEICRLLKDPCAFEAEMVKLSKESIDVLKSIESARKCCVAIEEALAPIFSEKIKAYPFGSRISGLGNIASDLDVFVDIGAMYEGTINQSTQFQSNCVQQTAQALRRHKDFTDICPIPLARTPIVQVFHKLTDLDCDLSFRHGLSIENTKYLKFSIDLQPKLKSLILLMKKWIRLNHFRDRISTYGISMMAIYFMQNRGHLPSLAKLREMDPQPGRIIAGWETFSFHLTVRELQPLYPVYVESERILLRQFFDFYISFDFEKDVICPLLGYSVPKAHFQALNLPKEMTSYVRKIQANTDPSEHMKITKSICIQDPFDLSHNVTKALAQELYIKMIILFKKSQQLLH